MRHLALLSLPRMISSCIVCVAFAKSTAGAARGLQLVKTTRTKDYRVCGVVWKMH